MIFGFQGHNCIHTVVDGQVRMKDREFVGFDEHEMNSRGYEAACRLWGELNP